MNDFNKEMMKKIRDMADCADVFESVDSIFFESVKI